MKAPAILLRTFALSVLCLTAQAQTPAPAAPSATPVRIDIGGKALVDALNELAHQAGLQLLLDADVSAQSATAPRISGSFTPEDALRKLLANSNLHYEFLDERTVAVRTSKPSRVSAPGASIGTTDGMLKLATADETQHAGAVEQSVDRAEETGRDRGIPEILVQGQRSSNADIRRTEDDIQPYVVFDAGQIRQAMAPDLETFLKTRLPMNQTRTSESQNVNGVRGNQSTINLRGLGPNQTLILVNGRRMPGVSDLREFFQPDINGIPLSAVERIEILPSTAGGIYGGGATGGVVNVILKHDYSGAELTARYDGAFEGGGSERRVDATGGFSLENGRTNVMVTASYRESNPLYVGDRHFASRSRAMQDANNRAALVALPQPMHGYTTNIRSANGSGLVLKDGLRPLNSPIAHVPVDYTGPAIDNGAVFLSTAGRYNVTLAEDPLGTQYSMLNASSNNSVAVNLRREFGSRIEAFADLSRYDSSTARSGSHYVISDFNVTLPEGPNNPFTQAVILSVPMPGYDASRLRTHTGTLTEQASGGLIVRLPHEWMAQGEYTWNRSTYSYDFPSRVLNADGRAALVDGRLNPLGDINADPIDFSPYYPGVTSMADGFDADYPAFNKDAVLRVAGPLMQLPGGALRLASLLEQREQSTGDRVLASYTAAATPAYTYYPEIGAETDSLYAELTAPMVSVRNARPGVLGLDLQASYRRDSTTTRTRLLSQGEISVPSPDGPFPDAPFQTNKVTGNQYTLGVRYTPVESLAVRLSYGEGILPPSSFQLSAAELSPALLSFFGLVDPKRGGAPVTSATVERFSISGNLLLRPERSSSWSTGLIFTPRSLPGLRMSVDYTRIRKVDEITSLNRQTLIDLEDSFPGYITRNPLTEADQALGYTGGTIRILDTGNVNLARSLIEALDIQTDYTWETRFGSFAANVMATVQPGLKRQATPDSAELNIVGYSDGPLKWRLNGGLRWSRGALDLGWNMQYYDASRVYTSSASQITRDRAILSQGSAWIGTQTYHDVYARYRFADVPGFADGWLENTELQFSVQNALNTQPPILASISSLSGGYATEGDARLRRYSAAITKRFGSGR